MMKQCVLGLWIGSVAAIIFGSGWVAVAGQWVFGLSFFAHIVEFWMNRSLFEKVGGSMWHHFGQTMIYGLFHFGPLKESLEGKDSN